MCCFRRVILLALNVLLSLSLSAQPTRVAVEGCMRSIDTLLTHQNVLQSLYITPELASVDVSDINRWASDLRRSQFSQSGLELSAGYDYRFLDENFVDDDYDGDEAVPYKHRFLVSLKWDIMQSGLIGRENFRQRVDILSRTKSQEVVNNMLRDIIAESSAQYLDNLYGYYNVLIDAKVELYGALIGMQEELVAKNQATLLSLSDMQIKRSNMMRMHKSGVAAGSGVIDLANYLADQIVFNGNEYDSLIENNSAIVRNRLRQELTQNEADGVSYWNEVKISPFARMYGYIDNSSDKKNAGKLGVTASLPLFTNTKSKRQEAVSRGKLLANDEDQIRRDISLEIDDLLRQLNENLTTLSVLVESANHYSEGCALAAQYYNSNTITIYELCQRYIDNLDNNIEIYKLIMEREEIKHTLFKVVYGV